MRIKMTRIGEPEKVRTIEKPPVPLRIPMKPIRVPEKIPVRIPEREPVTVGAPRVAVWNRIGMTVTEIPYSCPICSSDMVMEDGTLWCPEHGVVYE